MEKNKLFAWIGIGIVAAVVVIYLGISGGVKLPQNMIQNPGQNGEPVGEGGEPLPPVAGPIPNNPEMPQQSLALNASEVPVEAIKLSVSAAGFSPSSFTVDAGEAVTLAITFEDGAHVFMFDDPALQTVVLSGGKGETRGINFIAPENDGEYTFKCDIPGHVERGERGKMIVE